MKIEYIAADGNRFDDEKACVRYEKKYCQPNPHIVYTVSYKVPVGELSQPEVVALMDQLRDATYTGHNGVRGIVEVNYNKFGK